MDERQIQAIIYDLEDEEEEINSLIKEVEEDIEKNPDKKEEFEKEKQELLDDLHDVKCDIAMYKEMIDKLYPSEVGFCGFTCDGRCQTCSKYGYDSLYEVFAEGTY